MSLTDQATADAGPGRSESPSSGLTRDGEADFAEVTWSTHCRVPTATAIAEHLGYLKGVADNAARPLHQLREFSPDEAENHHQVHDIRLFREGGNIPPLWTRANGAQTRLIGLFWFEEGQAIVTAPDGAIHDAADLVGKRIAVPELSARTPQLQRPVALHGFQGVLGSIGKTLDDVHIVEVPSGDRPLQDFWRGTNAERPVPTLDAVAARTADAAYIVGPKSREYAVARGLHVALELDTLPGRQWRVNLGTPRALTVDQTTLDENYELVVDYLVRLLRASDWAISHTDEFYQWFAAATGSSVGTVRAIGSIENPGSLRVQLTDEFKHLYGLQKSFLVENGFIAGDFDLEEWADPAPLAEAYRRYQGSA